MARSYPVNEWAATREATLVVDLEQPFATQRNRRASAARSPRNRQFRSFSLSFVKHRPRTSLFAHGNLDEQLNDMAIDDSPEGHEAPHGSPQGHSNGESGTFKGILRRASLSLKGIVHRRPSHAHEDAAHDQRHAHIRPATAHAWNRLRQAASFRHARPTSGFDLPHETPSYAHPSTSPSFPIPAMGNEPPVIPTHTGAAAKASAAMQNEFFARQGSQTKWLRAPSSEDGNDRESGIGIAVNVPSIEVDDADAAVAQQDTRISRLNFISMLPAELAIHTLSFLDATALTRACRVCRDWQRIIENQHVWRESCLREMTTTFATSGPVQPGTGLGIPLALPSNDWRKIYQARQELNLRWRSGRARPTYLNGHSDSIYCLQFDEHKIISGSRDQTIRVWDMHTLKCKLVIGPPAAINGGMLLEDFEGIPFHYAMGAENVRVAESRPQLVSWPEHHMASILCLQYDDEILVTGSSDSTCIVYDINNGYRPIRRLRHHTAAVLDLAFDKKHIVTCSKDISICVWDRATGALLRQLRGHTGPVNAVQMRGNTIVSCSGDTTVKLWNIDTGKNIREFDGHTKGLACSQYSEDGRYVASAGNDKTICIWDANTGECIKEMRAHDNLVRSLHIDSVSGRLISGSYDTDIKVWDMATGRQQLDFPRWHASWVLSAKSDYRRIVSTGQDPKILIMDFGADVENIEMLEGGGPESGPFGLPMGPKGFI
ncbi:hypothetical protein JDV02_000566 [Purpureocillium takamizusanense]|nr:uncharacterized protein JDV02_000566 [Purpureocillium takamizusanense]UNI13871.1 hypothetical protein JDV02_000566 [Purpureocillium takamizusanense]